MNAPYVLATATREDHAELADVVFDAVRRSAGSYTPAERAAWVPRRPGGEQWHARLDRQVVVLARQGAAVADFMSLADGGYIDLAFIRPSRQGSGLFRRRFASIEDISLARGDDRLWIHASLMAVRAVASLGFRTVERQTV